MYHIAPHANIFDIPNYVITRIIKIDPSTQSVGQSLRISLILNWRNNRLLGAGPLEMDFLAFVDEIDSETMRKDIHGIAFSMTL